MLLRRDLKSINCFLFSFFFSFISILLLVFISGAPVRNEYIYNELTEWAKTGYFNTYDFRNYFVGIVVFGLSPFLFLFLLPKYLRVQKIFQRFKKIIIPSIIIFSLLLISNFILPKQKEILHLLNSKKRGQQLLQNIIYVPLIITLFLTVYFFIKLKLYHQWKNIQPVIRTLFSRLKQLNFRLPKMIIDFIVLALIFFLVINPKFKYSYQQLTNYGGEAGHEFHHTNFYLGPINEVIKGKSLMVDAKTQYGILTIYIPALIFHFTGISYANFTLYNMLLSIIYIFLLYIFFKIITKSRLWALLGILIFIKIIFFRYDPQNEIFIFPSSTPLRYFFDVLSLLSIYSLYQSYSHKKSFITGLTVGLTFYYNFEIGIPILVSYIATIMLGMVIKRRFLRPILFNFLFLFLSIFSIGLIISSVTYIRSGFYPSWYLMITPILFYTRGFFDIPMPIIGAYYIPLAVYILTFYIILFKLLKRNYNDIYILCFLLIYGISSFFYYLGFNVPDHLLTVIHPSLILMLIYIWWVYKNHDFFGSLSAIYKSIFITLVIVYLSFSIWPPNELWQNTWGKIYRRYSKLPQNYYKWDYPGTDIYLADDDGKNFLKAAHAIKKYASDEKDILIISRYDTLLFVMAQKTSLVNYPILEYEIVYKTDLGKTIEEIKNKKPKYIFVFSKEYNQMSNDNLTKIWEGIKKKYSFVENGGVVDIYKLLFYYY